MNDFTKYISESLHVLEVLASDVNFQQTLIDSIDLLCEVVKKDLPILICGNGGSASDAEHFAAELVGRFLKNRPAIRAYALTTTGATMTALSNDFGYEHVFARQVEAYGTEGGILIGISTSGKSANVLNAFSAAKKKDMHTMALIGAYEGSLSRDSKDALDVDIILSVPSTHTPYIQQAHLCIYHYICAQVEGRMIVS